MKLIHVNLTELYYILCNINKPALSRASRAQTPLARFARKPTAPQAALRAAWGRCAPRLPSGGAARRMGALRAPGKGRGASRPLVALHAAGKGRGAPHPQVVLRTARKGRGALCPLRRCAPQGREGERRSAPPLPTQAFSRATRAQTLFAPRNPRNPSPVSPQPMCAKKI